MKTNIFKTPRRGWLGHSPKGAEYMQDVNERAKRMEAATAIGKHDQFLTNTDNRQLRLPNF